MGCWAVERQGTFIGEKKLASVLLKCPNKPLQSYLKHYFEPSPLVESEKSQERLQQDLAVLAQLTLPTELQFQLHYWKELPLGPWPITWDALVDVIFNVQQKLFFCHKVGEAGFNQFEFSFTQSAIVGKLYYKNDKAAN